MKSNWVLIQTIVFASIFSCSKPSVIIPEIIGYNNENCLDTLLQPYYQAFFSNSKLFTINKVDVNHDVFEVMNLNFASSEIEILSFWQGSDSQNYPQEWSRVSLVQDNKTQNYPNYLFDTLSVDQQNNMIQYKFSFISKLNYDMYLIFFVYNDSIISSKEFIEPFGESNIPYLGMGKISIIFFRFNYIMNNEGTIEASHPSIRHDFSVQEMQSNIYFSKLLPKIQPGKIEEEIENNIYQYIQSWVTQD